MKNKELLKEFFKNNEDIIIINIGTDRCTGDSYAPYVGTILNSDNNFPYKVYGTLEEPIHAQNIGDKLEIIYNNHPNSKVIGIDAAMGDDVLKIICKNEPIKCGSAMGKNLPWVGDICIKGVVMKSRGDVHVNNYNIYRCRLSEIIKMASETVEYIKECI